MTIATATLAQWFELVGHVGIAHTSLRASFESRLNGAGRASNVDRLEHRIGDAHQIE